MRHPARAGRVASAALEQPGEIAAPEASEASEALAEAPTAETAAPAVDEVTAAAAVSPEPDPVSIEIESVQAPEPEPFVESEPETKVAGRAPLMAAEPEGTFEPKTTELQRPPPAPSSLLAELTTPAPDLLDDPSAVELSEVEDTIPLALNEAFPRDRDEAEVKTRPKIRLPDAPKRPTPPPPRASQTNGEVALAQARLSSSVPPKASPRSASPLPPTPTPVGQAPGTGPSGEGIVRSSPPPARPIIASFDRDSEVPTRPRIPLTHDMALAAGRITSQEVTPYNLDESLAATRPRLPRMPANRSQTEDPNPAVIVSRARVISDRPPTGGDQMDRALGRPSRKPRPDSEEFETLDIEDGVEEPSRLEITNGSAGGNTSGKTLETGVRVSRTPPPPPSQPQARRSGTTGQHAQQRPAPPPPPPAVPAKKPAPAAQQQKPARKRAWWEVLFSDDYVRTLPRPSSAAVAKQVSFMEASLGIKRGDAVLDVGCGLGQHALEFARRGYLVVALDLALSMITRAAEEAQQRGLRINFLHKDIRDIGFEGTFDAIICVGTTFGFFDDEQNKNVLQRLAHALKPGGRLLLDVVNRDFVIGSQPNLVWFEGEGCVVMEESDFNFYSSRLNVKRTMMREDGRQSDSEYSIRLYSVHELGQLLKQAGFSIKEVSGQEATRGLFFGAQSTRVIMLAERRANARNSREGSTPPGSDVPGD